MTQPLNWRPVGFVTELGRCLIWRAGRVPERAILRRLVRNVDATLTPTEATQLRRWLSRQIWARRQHAVALDLLIGWVDDAETRGARSR
jgi:hypothetical protein